MEKDWTGGFSSVFTTMGAVGHSSHEREKHDYYATEPKAAEWLCRIEKFEGKILEPSCGEGHISGQRGIVRMVRLEEGLSRRNYFEMVQLKHYNCV